MESQCHLGKTCLYRHNHELVLSNDFSSTAKVDIRYHGIIYVIKQFLESATMVPECQVERDCVDCEHWTFT
jgi:putative lipase involved disintegration of autophagic bodies